MKMPGICEGPKVDRERRQSHAENIGKSSFGVSRHDEKSCWVQDVLGLCSVTEVEEPLQTRKEGYERLLENAENN